MLDVYARSFIEASRFTAHTNLGPQTAQRLENKPANRAWRKSLKQTLTFWI